MMRIKASAIAREDQFDMHGLFVIVEAKMRSASQPLKRENKIIDLSK